MPRKTIKDYETEARNRIELIDHLHREISRLTNDVEAEKKLSRQWYERHSSAKNEVQWFKQLVQNLVSGRNSNALPR